MLALYRSRVLPEPGVRRTGVGVCAVSHDPELSPCLHGDLAGGGVGETAQWGERMCVGQVTGLRPGRGKEVGLSRSFRCELCGLLGGTMTL